MIALRIIYILNILVAGQIAISALSNPKHAALTTFGNAYQPTEVIKLVGCLWLAIAVLSILGLWKPVTFSPVLLLQVIYKGTWLFIVALPAFRNDTPFPKTMALFFIVWVLVLPFVIPWKAWLH
ncbi:hypothetical protein FGM00_02225 [Aggregatimonas sangjinii]|uniref:Uncharacterized protein n=1 Tax=Aggregatimonas sangjinii TaxID=2583587 RepID=A0A5B7SNK1_9FLAO|nr:hypothetical protein [Aggregatimonas sangjinii]QCW98988.1 hypothetical protein FGM00_02225 [Aggregatimonas sangjinii]